MYNHIRGTLVHIAPGSVVLEAAGVGYEITVPVSASQSFGKLGEEAVVLTHLVVREDLMQLIGFKTDEQRVLFRTLIGLSGVGPSLALQIVGAVNPDEFALAVERQDSSFLKKIKGIGAKKANQILVGLKGAKMLLAPDKEGIAPGGVATDAVQALQAMGVSEREAIDRVNRVLAAQPELSLEDLVKQSLR